MTSKLSVGRHPKAVRVFSLLDARNSTDLEVKHLDLKMFDSRKNMDVAVIVASELTVPKEVRLTVEIRERANMLQTTGDPEKEFQVTFFVGEERNSIIYADSMTDVAAEDIAVFITSRAFSAILKKRQPPTA